MAKFQLNKKKESALLHAIGQGNLEVLKAPYETYKAEFMHFCSKYGAEPEDVLDAYQDAFVALIENVQHKGLSMLSASLKTYLFSIGKFILFHKLRKSSLTTHIDPELSPLIEWQVDDWSEIESDKQKKLRLALDALGGKCREVIFLFYYRQWSIREIMEHMGYANENTVKAHKSRCMKKLLEKIRAK